MMTHINIPRLYKLRNSMQVYLLGWKIYMVFIVILSLKIMCKWKVRITKVFKNADQEERFQEN